jgi:hypothetical protein
MWRAHVVCMICAGAMALWPTKQLQNQVCFELVLCDIYAGNMALLPTEHLQNLRPWTKALTPVHSPAAAMLTHRCA